MEITKWEYKSIRVASPDKKDVEELEKAGKEGWEVTGVTSFGIGILKRPCGKIIVEERVNTTGVEIKENIDFNTDQLQADYNNQQNNNSGWGY
ncbi:MAG: hypothetical protein MJ188_06385 [Treponema sp.]|nr:hypothetical protein [Treponema sp.]